MIKRRIIWSGGIFFVLLISTMSLSQPLFQVTNEVERVHNFTWSPDGTQLAYLAQDGQDVKMYRIDVDGSNRFMLDEKAGGNVDWKGEYIIFRKYVEGAPAYYDRVWVRVRPDGSDSKVLTTTDWYNDAVLRADGKWLLYRFAPNGWWQAKKCDIDGNNVSVVSHDALLHGIGWMGKNHILYARGLDYNTTCGIYKVNFTGGNLEQLTAEDLPSNAQFAASPDSSKILYCAGSATDWNIWVMDADGANKLQLTDNTARDELSWPLENIWSNDCQSFYFVSKRSGNGDVYRLNIDGAGLTRITYNDSTDRMPNLSPDGSKLAFISSRSGVDNVWVLDLNAVIVTLPDTSVQNISMVDVPIRIFNLSNQEIYSFNFEVDTNPEVLLPQRVITLSALAEGWGQPTPNIQGGTIKLAMAGVNPITESGILAYIRYGIPETIVCDDTSSIEIIDFMFNENQPPNIAFDGRMIVSYQFDVTGQVRYYTSNFGVPDVSLILDGFTVTSDIFGEFQFEAIPCGDYSLIPEYIEPAPHAINPYDAALIIRAANDFITLTPYQNIAADVTGNGVVTAFDASYILRYFVGLISEFPVGEYWRFVPADFLINETNWTTAPDSIEYQPLHADEVDQDFVGIVYGDVSGNWAPESEKFELAMDGKTTPPQIVFGEIRKERDDVFVLPVSVDFPSEIFSLGITCLFENDGYLFLGSKVVAENSLMFACDEKKGRIKVGLASALPVDKNQTIFEMRFRQSGTIHPEKECSVLVGEVYLNGARFFPHFTEVAFKTDENIPGDFALFQNFPNPFNSKTLIRFEIPEPSWVNVSIFNLLGQKIRTLFNEEKAPGVFQIYWDGKNEAGDVVGTGEYLCRMRAGEFSAVRKIVVMR